MNSSIRGASNALSTGRSSERRHTHQDQGARYPSNKEDTLNIIRIPNLIYGIFRIEGLLGPLGSLVYLL